MKGNREGKSIEVRSLKRSELLRLKPLRKEHIFWEEDEEGVVRIKSERVGLLARIMGLILRITPRRYIQLDEIGSIVWKMCDGEHTVAQISQELMKRYKLERREAETSLLTFIQHLLKRRLITLRFDDLGNESI
ncbi:MAG: hypothetical protein RUDDFDWM_000242 [Candidatus Fervidibacterota bacterium]